MTYQLVNLQEYSTFDSIQAMDNTVRQYNAKISKTHYETLNLLKQYSCKVIGVSHLKIKTIANRLGKSTRTITRHLKYFKEQGFISVINTIRTKSGGKGANTYVINPIEIQQQIISVVSKMSNCNSDKKHNQYQSQQALAYVQIKKETISILKLLKSLISNRSGDKQIRLKRIENIKNFRTCPDDVPQDLYDQYKPFFSDAQIKTLFNLITIQATPYESISDPEFTYIVNNTFNSLIKALRKEHRGEGVPIRNIFAYASGTAKKIAFKVNHIKKWDKMWTLPSKFEQENVTFKQASIIMWQKAGIIDDEDIPY